MLALGFALRFRPPAWPPASGAAAPWGKVPGRLFVPPQILLQGLDAVLAHLPGVHDEPGGAGDPGVLDPDLPGEDHGTEDRGLLDTVLAFPGEFPWRLV